MPISAQTSWSANQDISSVVHKSDTNQLVGAPKQNIQRKKESKFSGLATEIPRSISTYLQNIYLQSFYALCIEEFCHNLLNLDQKHQFSGIL